MAERVVAWRWYVIAAWVVLGIVLIALAPSLTGFTSAGYGLPASYQSTQAEAIAVHDFPSVASASGIIEVNATDNTALTAPDIQKINALATTLDGNHIASVRSVSTSPLFLSKNQKMQLVQVSMYGQPGENGPNAAVKTLRSDTDAFLKGSGLRGQLTGSAAISVDQASAFNRAEKIISIATVLLILILLALVFRSVIIAFLPLLVVGLVHQMATALTAFFAQWFGFTVSTELAPLLIVVMFGVGTDYIVFMLFRYREQLAKGQGPHESLMVALCRAGEVIASAAATVMLAFAALLVASIGQLRSLAPGLIIGVGLMLLAALTLVPAVLSLFGTTLFWPSTPKPHDPSHRTRSERMGAAVAKRPGIVLLGSVVVLVVLATGVLNLKVTYNQLAELPQDNPSTQAYNTISTAFPAGFLGPSQVFVRSATPLNATTVDALASKLAHTEGVAQVLPVQYASGNSAALIEFLLTNDPYSNQAIADMAGPVRAAIVGTVPGATVVTGGPTATLTDVKAALQIDTRNILLLALLVVAVMLAILLRALAGAAYLLIGILLTYVATLGVVTYIFISGLGYDGLDFSIPIIVYIFVIAVGTDYNILMATRLREEFEQGVESHEAARIAIVEGAPAVTAAGIILAGTFASLLLTGIQLLEEIGAAVALGVLLASNVLATRIVPTLAALRGFHFWWPHHTHTKTVVNREELVSHLRSAEPVSVGSEHD
ncbi:MAG TPA: MMPL family transporter [Acidimicrobiales bacterium]|nr:MMPL family transporter [Acidimicrobiales bacterium]